MNEKAIAWIIEMLEAGDVKKATQVLKDVKHSLEAKKRNGHA